MTNENNPIDDLFKSKLENLESEPAESSWEAISKKLQEENLQKTESTNHSYYWWAAAAILIITSVFVFRNFNQEITTKPNIATIETAKNETIVKNETSQNNNPVAQEPKKAKIYLSKNSIKEVKLADGSLIVLDKNSVVTVPENYPYQRTITLRGRAFFNVVKNTELPSFMVSTNFSECTVKGTSFTINAPINSNSNQLWVKSGVVSIKNLTTNDSKEINAGEKISLVDGKLIEKNKINSANFESWKTETLKFNNTPLNVVASDIADYYNVKVLLNNEKLQNCKFTGEFSKYSIDELLQVLSTSFNLSHDFSQNTYIIKGEGCK